MKIELLQIVMIRVGGTFQIFKVIITTLKIIVLQWCLSNSVHLWWFIKFIRELITKDDFWTQQHTLLTLMCHSACQYRKWTLKLILVDRYWYGQISYEVGIPQVDSRSLPVTSTSIAIGGRVSLHRWVHSI